MHALIAFQTLLFHLLRTKGAKSKWCESLCSVGVGLSKLKGLISINEVDLINRNLRVAFRSSQIPFLLSCHWWWDFFLQDLLLSQPYLFKIISKETFFTLEVAKPKLSRFSISLLGSSLWLFFLLGSIS